MSQIEEFQTQKDALNEFWRHVSQTTDYQIRIEWLQKLAKVRVEPYDGWDYVRERRAWARNRARVGERLKACPKCFACARRRSAHVHHIVQAQHGGSNAKRNQVAVCRRCHVAIHPWMDARMERRRAVRAKATATVVKPKAPRAVALETAETLALHAMGCQPGVPRLVKRA